MSNENYRTVIKQQHIRHREIVIVASTVAAAVVLVLGFYLGQQAAYSGMGVDPGAYTEMKASLPANEQKAQELQEELDVLQVQHQMDGTALELVRRELAAQNGQIEKLEEGLAFYKSLMAPEEIAQGFSLRPLELVETDASNRYSFRLVAQQEALKHTTLKGSLSVEVFGSGAEGAVSYPLADLSSDVEDNTIALRFRYFQSIEGELVIPEGFTPEGFRVIARASSPRKVELREQFPWVVMKRFTYVGK